MPPAAPTRSPSTSPSSASPPIRRPDHQRAGGGRGARRAVAGFYSLLLVTGTKNLVELARSAGFRTTETADDDPDAVLQGYNPGIEWRLLDEASIAVQRGATWYGTNDDLNRPTDRGLVPGLGAQLAVVASTVRQQPIVFGKPHAPMLDFAVKHTGAQRPIFVGDRIDTDIMGGNRAGMPTLLAFTGAHGKRDLLEAGLGDRPTFIGADLARCRTRPGSQPKTATPWASGAATAQLRDGSLVMDVAARRRGRSTGRPSGRWPTWSGPPAWTPPRPWDCSINCGEPPVARVEIPVGMPPLAQAQWRYRR